MNQIPTVHLCLVSAQATPNLTATLDPAVRPRRVVLLTSPDMQRRAQWLEQVLKPRGIEVHSWSIDNAWDLEHIRDRVLDLLVQYPDEAIALNATGGTKPMSIAAYEVFRAADCPIFYVHPEKDRLMWMSPSDREPLELANRLRLEHFLQAHGARVESLSRESIPKHLHQLTNGLVEGVAKFGHALGVLNYLASSAEEGMETLPIPRAERHNRKLDILIDGFADHGLLRRVGDRLRFADEDARFFVNGGWMEDHIFQQVQRLRSLLPAIQDVARGVNVVRTTARGDQVPNELDVALLSDNRLYIIECKTRNFKKGGRGAPGSNALYKLDTLKDLLGGLQGRAMLVSYRNLPSYDRQRAADLGIRVCAGADLTNLRGRLTEWIG